MKQLSSSERKRMVMRLPSRYIGTAVLEFTHANIASKTGFACFSRSAQPI